MDAGRERRALDVFEEALAVPAADRAAWLNARYGNDPEIVRRVLAYLATEGDNDLMATVPAEPLALDAPRSVPETIGVYRLGERIGQGGMGAVYRGERIVGGFAQTVAIKLIRPSAFSVQARDHFAREREILASLHHPHITQLLDGGTAGDQSYIVMELVSGPDLIDYVAVKRSSLDERLALFDQVCDAVAYAHSRGVIHADIKPSNIIVDPDHGAKLLDFGIAGLIGATPEGGRSATQAYASPEQKAGRPPAIGDDVFALGVLLERLVAECPGVDAELRSVIARARAGRAEDRYESADSLRADVGRWRGRYPVLARKPSAVRQALFFWRRNRLPASLGAALALGLLAGSAVVGALYLRAETQRAQAERRFDQVRSLANYLLFDVYDALARHAGTVPQREAIAARAAVYLDQLNLTNDTPYDLRLDVARGYRRLGDILGVNSGANLGQPARAGKMIDRAGALLEPLLREKPRDADALTEMGWVEEDRWILLPDNDEPIATNRRGRRDFQAALALDPNNQRAWLGLVTTYKFEGFDLIIAKNQLAKAEAVLRQGLARLRAHAWPAANLHDARILEIGLLNRLAYAQSLQHRLPDALSTLQGARALTDRLLAAEGPTPQNLDTRADIAFSLGRDLVDSQRGTEAMPILRGAEADLESEIARGADQQASMRLGMLIGQEASALDDAGRKREALRVYAHYVDIERDWVRSAPADVHRWRELAIATMEYGRVLGEIGETRKACEAASESVQWWRRIAAKGALGGHDRAVNLPKAEHLAALRCAT